MKVRAGETEHVRELKAEDGYSGVVQLEGLKPSQEYPLEVSFGPAPEQADELTRKGHFKTFPPEGQSAPLTFLLNSCNFHGWGRFRNNDTASQRRAEIARGVDMVIHAGDQVYADKAPMSFSLEEFRSAYRRTWGHPATQTLLASQANYMVADDHEVANGFSLDGQLSTSQRATLWLKGVKGTPEQQFQSLVQNGTQAFDEHQASHAPRNYGPEARYYSFSHGQAKFFALDTRFERIASKGQMISPEQKAHLLEWLSENRDYPKFIITSSPFVIENVDPSEKWSSPEFSAQRHQILDYLAEHKIPKTVFLCGDIHASAHAQMTLTHPDGSQVEVHELCASPVNGTLQRGLHQFRTQVEGETAQGVRYQSQLDQESFLGRSWWQGTQDSAVMKVKLAGEKVSY
jgi:phosphodiesterase/alkaline phosphatase D-like protein